MTRPISVSKDLRSRLTRLRYFLPFALFAVVLFYQILVQMSSIFSRAIYTSCLISSPMALSARGSWFTLSWIITKVEESDRALADKAQAEKNSSARSKRCTNKSACSRRSVPIRRMPLSRSICKELSGRGIAARR